MPFRLLLYYMVSATRLMNRMIKLFENKNHIEHYVLHRPTWPTGVSQVVVNYALSLRPKPPVSPVEKPKFGTLVDIGCGSGQSTPMYASFCERILGLDPSEEQIKHAIKSNTFKNIEYSVGHGEKIPLPEESVDIVCCAQSAHWLDYDAFFKECERVLKPDGCMAVYGYTMAKLKVPGEKTDGGCNNLFHTFFKKCDFHPRRAHVDNRMTEFFEKVPSVKKTRDDSMHIQRDWNLSDLEGYIESWSGYRKLATAGDGASLLQTLIGEILAASRAKDAKSCNIGVDWSIFMILSTRPSK